MGLHLSSMRRWSYLLSRVLLTIAYVAVNVLASAPALPCLGCPQRAQPDPMVVNYAVKELAGMVGASSDVLQRNCIIEAFDFKEQVVNGWLYTFDLLFKNNPKTSTYCQLNKRSGLAPYNPEVCPMMVYMSNNKEMKIENIGNLHCSKVVDSNSMKMLNEIRAEHEDLVENINEQDDVEENDDVSSIERHGRFYSCKCYNPFEGQPPILARFGEPDFICENQNHCYVSCNSDCYDLEHDGGIRCYSRAACSPLGSIPPLF